MIIVFFYLIFIIKILDILQKMNKLKNKLSMLERNMQISLNINDLSFKVDLSQASEDEQK
jgi:predicted Holliday junction resolvase-like endonuclease